MTTYQRTVIFHILKKRGKTNAVKMGGGDPSRKEDLSFIYFLFVILSQNCLLFNLFLDLFENLVLFPEWCLINILRMCCHYEREIKSWSCLNLNDVFSSLQWTVILSFLCTEFYSKIKMRTLAHACSRFNT